jgi:hypothetical protein
MTNHTRILKVKSVKTDKEANEHFEQNWDLFAVVSAPHRAQTDIQAGQGINPFDYILVRRG